MKIRVAVLRGGPSHAYGDSLKTGAFVMDQLRDSNDYEPLDIFISREGQWHYKGLVEDPNKILKKADVAWNTLRGEYGEDGRVQKVLENFHMPYSGSSAFSTALANNKEAAKNIYIKHALSTPQFVTIGEDDMDSDKKFIHVYRNFMHPVIVKPNNGARGFGVRLAHTFKGLKEAVKKILNHSSKALVEEYISGTSVSCAVLEDAKGHDLYAFMPTHIKISRNIATPSRADNKLIEEMARQAHQALDLRHFSTSDFIITTRGKIYILETNSVPTLFENSIMHQSLLSSGWRPQDFVDHSLKLALGKH